MDVLNGPRESVRACRWCRGEKGACSSLGEGAYELDRVREPARVGDGGGEGANTLANESMAGEIDVNGREGASVEGSEGRRSLEEDQTRWARERG